MATASAAASATAATTTSSSSKWKWKLQTRIENLSETSSAESIQTLGNWICFHRVKRSHDIVSCLCSLLLQNKVLSRKQLLVWKVIHSILIFEFSSSSRSSSGASGGASTTTTTTRTRMMEQQQARLRSLIGESLPSVLEELGPSVPDVELLAFLKEWDSRQVFDSPTLMAQIWRIFKDRRSSSSSTGSGNQNNNRSKAAADADPAAMEGSSSTTAAAPLAAATTTVKVKVKKEEADEEVEYEPMDEEEATAAPLPSSNKDTSTVEGMMMKKKEDDDTKPVEMTAATPTIPTAAGAGAGAGAVPSSTSSATATVSAPASAPATPAPVAVNVVVNSYDFDAKGVPEGQVLPSEFLEPCKAISTLQIARDVRSNPAMERSGLLSLLPKDIWSTCQQLHNSNNEQQQQQGKTTAEADEDLVVASMSVLDDETTLDEYSKRIPSTLLDLDIEEELSSLELYQDIVERQTKAREKLIHLLLKSRCKFGAENAASFFYNDMQDPTIVDKLKKRKQVLQDALELEGADTAQIEQEEMAKKYNSHNKKRKTGSSSSSSTAAATTTTTMDDDDDDLPPFEWYSTKKGLK